MSGAPNATPGQILLWSILGKDPGPTVTVNDITYITADLASDDDYWNAQPAIVTASRPAMYAGATNANSVCAELAGLGYLIDTPIMNYGWDAIFTMWQREMAGLSSVPDWTNTRKIPVSVFKKDYPSLIAPPVPPSTAPVQLVGDLLAAQTAATGKNVYALAIASMSAINAIVNGQQAVAPDGTPVHAVVTRGLMGNSIEWVAD